MVSRFSNINPLHFDNAVYDLYGGLANGATLVPVETAAQTNPARWVRSMRDARASMIFAVPTLFQTLSQVNLLKPHLLPDARISCLAVRVSASIRCATSMLNFVAGPG